METEELKEKILEICDEMRKALKKVPQSARTIISYYIGNLESLVRETPEEDDEYEDPDEDDFV